MSSNPSWDDTEELEDESWGTTVALEADSPEDSDEWKRIVAGGPMPFSPRSPLPIPPQEAAQAPRPYINPNAIKRRVFEQSIGDPRYADPTLMAATERMGIPNFDPVQSDIQSRAIAEAERIGRTPLVNITPGLEALQDINPAVNLLKRIPAVKEVLGGATESLGEGLSSMTSPEGLTQLPMYAVPGLGQGLMIKGGLEMAEQGAENAVEAIATGDRRLLGRAVGDIAQAGALGVPGVKGAAKLVSPLIRRGEPVARPPAIPETAVTDRPINRGETPLTERPNATEKIPTEEGVLGERAGTESQRATKEAKEEIGADSVQREAPKAEAASVKEEVAASPLPKEFTEKPVADTAKLFETTSLDSMGGYGKGPTGVGGPTGFAYDVGSMAKTPADVAALKETTLRLQEKGPALFRKFKEAIEAGDEAAQFSLQKEITRAQLAHEAYQAATGENLSGKLQAVDAIKKVNPNYEPPVPGENYLKEKAKSQRLVPEPIPGAEKFQQEAATPAAEAARKAVETPAQPLSLQTRKTPTAVRGQLEKALQRLRDEERGKQILEMLEEEGRTPKQVVEDFWNDTYPALAPEIQKRFQSLVKAETGFTPGDVVAIGEKNERIQAKDWNEVYPTKYAPDTIRHMEGTERGLISMMELANRNRDVLSQKTPNQTPAVQESLTTEPAPIESAVPAQAVGIVPRPSELAAEGAKAVGDVLRYYSEPLTERLATEGGSQSKGFATMSKQIAQRSKELFGNLTPELDPALQASGAANRATTWLNDISPVSNKPWGYRNVVSAVENAAAVIPEGAQGTVDLIKAANLKIGQLPEGVVPDYKASGKYQRPPTEFLVDTIRSGKGKAHDILVESLAAENKMPKGRVKEILTDIKTEYDEPGSKQTVHKIAQEFERHFDKFPTDLEVGGVWMPILHAKPYDYLLNAAKRTTQRVAFLERIPQGTLEQLRKGVVSELKSPEAFDDLVRSLHGLPVNEPLRLFPPGSPQGQVVSGANRVLSDVFAPIKLTASAIYNIPETVLGNTPAFFGWRNAFRGATTLAQRHAALENMGAINKAIYNWSMDPKAPVRSLLAGFRNGLRKGTAQQFFNELQEKLAGSTAQVFAERAQGKDLSKHEANLFAETAVAMGVERPAAEAMSKGNGTAEQYGDFTRRAPAFATGGNIQPAEMSRFGGNRVVSSLFKFQSYPIMKLNAFRKAYINVSDAIESGNSGRMKASTEQLAKFLFGTAAQGAAATFLGSLLTGRGGGVTQQAEELKDEPGGFVLDSVLGGMGGPLSAINYAVGSGKARDLVDPRKLNAGITFPGSIYLELKEMFNREGPYAGMTLKQATSRYATTKAPIGKAITHALDAAGLVENRGAAMRDLYRIHEKFIKEHPSQKVRDDFARRQDTVYGTSGYAALDAAIAGRDASALKEARAELKAKGYKNKAIEERMEQRYKTHRVNDLGNRKAKPLFHEGEKVENEFKASLTKEQRALYDKAREETGKDYSWWKAHR